jgi:hypothetical protein
LQNNSCFAIEKNRYFPAPTENGWLPAAAVQLSGEVRLSVDPFSWSTDSMC